MWLQSLWLFCKKKTVQVDVQKISLKLLSTAERIIEQFYKSIAQIYTCSYLYGLILEDLWNKHKSETKVCKVSKDCTRKKVFEKVFYNCIELKLWIIVIETLIYVEKVPMLKHFNL